MSPAPRACGGLGVVEVLGLTPQATAMSPLRGPGQRRRRRGPGADATRLLQCRPLRGLRWRWRRRGPGADATRLLQCRPLRGLGWRRRRRRRGPGADATRLLQCRPLRGLGWNERPKTQEELALLVTLALTHDQRVVSPGRFSHHRCELRFAMMVLKELPGVRSPARGLVIVSSGRGRVCNRKA